MARTAGMTLDEARKLYVLMACLHDIGKFATAFQALDPGACEAAGCFYVEKLPYSKRDGTGHVELGAWCWFDDCASLFSDALGLEDAADLATIRLIGTAAFGHH